MSTPYDLRKVLAELQEMPGNTTKRTWRLIPMRNYLAFIGTSVQEGQSSGQQKKDQR